MLGAQCKNTILIFCVDCKKRQSIILFFKILIKNLKGASYSEWEDNGFN